MISDKRMKELIRMARDAALIHDFTPYGMGLPMRMGFSNEIYKSTLAILVERESEYDSPAAIGDQPEAKQ